MEILLRQKRSGEGLSRILSDRGTITVPASHINFPGASKLVIDNLADCWLAYSQRNSHTWVSFVSDETIEDRSIDIIALLNCNRGFFLPPDGAISQNSDNLVRIMVDSDPLVNRIRPEITSFSKTNLTGLQSAIEGPVHPPSPPISASYTADRLTATNPALNTVLTVGYANHFASERPLTGTQLFYLHIRNSSDPALWVDVSVVLVQSGVDIATLGTISDPELTSEGLLFTYDFDAAAMPSSFAAISFRITSTTSGGAVGEPIGVSLVANLGNLLYDSGWIDGTENVSVLPAVDFPTPLEPIYIQIEWSDYISLQSHPTLSGNIVNVYTDVGGLFFAGRLIAGDSLSAPLRAEDGFSLRKSTTLDNTFTYSSDMRSNRFASTRWEADLVVCAQKQAKIFGELEDLFNALGIMQYPTLFIPDPNDLNTMLWACLGSWEAPHLGLYSGVDDEGQQYSNEEMYELAFSIVEKTGRKVPR